METILVTGGSGYIGSHIVTALLSANYKVIIVDHDEPHYSLKNIIYYMMDITDMEQLKRVFKHKIDKIIHLAAVKSVPESVADPLKYYWHNVVGSINIIKLMQQHQVKQILFSSTAVVYEPGFNVKENDLLNPTSPYGDSKLIIERLLEKLNIGIVFRYFNVIGNLPGFADTGPNVMGQIVKALHGAPFHLTGTDYDTPDGTGIRDYVHVMDIAAAHLKCLNLSGHHVYNLGTNQGTSVLQLINTMEQVSGRKINVIKSPRRDGDCAVITCSADKIKPLWKAQHDVMNMCQDVWNN